MSDERIIAHAIFLGKSHKPDFSWEAHDREKAVDEWRKRQNNQRTEQVNAIDESMGRA